MRIAAILTCFNRREKTLSSLTGLREMTLPHGATLSIFLTDDNSQDGTGQAVMKRFPDVNLLQGSGSLFWGGGMRLAFAEAIKQDFDFYFWVNDDTFLFPDALERLLSTYEYVAKVQKEAIVVGSIYDPGSGEFSYGGRSRGSKLRPLKNMPIQPTDSPQQCYTANGNCLLVPRAIVNGIGNISPCYTQTMGDYDYSLRARKAGFTVWIAPGWAGTCSKNPFGGVWRDPQVPLRERLRLQIKPKGLPPKEWGLFTRTYGGPFWFLVWLSPYVKTVFAGLRSPVKEEL